MDWPLFAGSCSFFITWVALGAAFAKEEGTFTATQMRRRAFAPPYLPFAWHLGMWTDVVIISPLLGYIIAAYGSKWSPFSGAVAIVLAFIGSWAMHNEYRKLPWNGTHVLYGRLTQAGYSHVGYMAAGFAVIGLFYFSPSARPTKEELFIVSLLIFVHVFVGTLIPLKIWMKRRKLYWFPVDRVIDPFIGIQLAAVAVLLVAASLLRIYLY